MFVNAEKNVEVSLESSVGTVAFAILVEAFLRTGLLPLLVEP